MVKTLSIVLVLIVLVLTVACDSNDGTEQDTSLSTASIPLADGEWELRADRVLSRKARMESFPWDNLTEDDFIPAPEEPTDSVKLSVDRSELLIRLGIFDGDSVAADLIEVLDDVVKYDVVGGTGGRFLVWPADGSIQAELALYGSGVPITICFRGSMVPSP